MPQDIDFICVNLLLLLHLAECCHSIENYLLLDRILHCKGFRICVGSLIIAVARNTLFRKSPGDILKRFVIVNGLIHIIRSASRQKNYKRKAFTLCRSCQSAAQLFSIGNLQLNFTLLDTIRSFRCFLL